MSVARSAIVLQARMTSQRLPGKVLMPLGRRTLVGRCLDRLIASRVAPVVLATSIAAIDDQLEAEASARGVRTIRGPLDDVLARFVQAAEAVAAAVVVRATADNPAVDIEAPQRVLETLVAVGADYVGEVGLPYGAAVEAVTVDALRRAQARARDAQDREHVTLAIKRDRARFHVVEQWVAPSIRRPDLRVTVDTPEDLRYMEAVLALAEQASPEPSLREIIAAADLVRIETAA